jgi:polysaccharide pyruvyl transferase WcaK-like protein
MNSADSSRLPFLHIASFSGNVGDNASHSGLRAAFLEATSIELVPTPLEIRRSYRNYDGASPFAWGTDFVGLTQAHPLTIVGGGNFFAPSIPSSRSGTTIDIDGSHIEQLTSPVVFHAIGFDPYQPWTDETIARFHSLMQSIASSESALVFFRNDGSKSHLERFYGKEFAAQCRFTPDPGFFVAIPKAHSGIFVGRRPYIAVNLAKDMLANRFGQGGIEQTSALYNNYLQQLRNWVISTLAANPALEIVFVPHIYSDLQAITDLLDLLPESVRRTKIHVAPCVTGTDSEQTIFSIYRDAEMAVGNRFHTSVCCIGLGVPTIGLSTYPKLKDLYREVGLPDRCLTASTEPFEDALISLTANTLENLEAISNRYRSIRAALAAEAALNFQLIAAHASRYRKTA